MIATAPTEAPLSERFRAFRAQNPKVRIRDAAARLGASEAELVATGVDGPARRLRVDVGAFLHEMPKLGKVMALTRNEAAVHERRGTYEKVEVDPVHALVLGPDIDLRIFPSRWKHAFATERSLQFFDAHGDAVHKVFREDSTDKAAFDALVETLAWEDAPPLALTPRPEPKPAPRMDRRDVPVAALHSAWSAMKDPHDFFGMLMKLKLPRTVALESVGRPWAAEVPVDTFDRLLTTAAREAVPVMVFVGNKGCIQIHSGKVTNVRRVGDWMNVLDPEFNLHVRTDLCTRAFVVRKPSAEGNVTSLEVFDAQGELVLQLFGARKPGVPELESWRALVDAQVEGQW